MERGLRYWVCAKNHFAQMCTLKRRQTQDHKKRLLQSSLSLPETTPLTLGQSGPFIKIQKMCYNLGPLLNYSTEAVVLNYSTEAESKIYNIFRLFYIWLILKSS